ncbi:CLUMA_CG011192, isoform A [Clunio marinus]|uniref:CLUMA_CG011192, isoform A n=1 Tax=Clunio marinus TaxID=568069 RepID=A0A1J1IC64_9DIPT|nr:CLUMA_CG011192, isoform A [Clunio marinus]
MILAQRGMKIILMSRSLLKLEADAKLFMSRFLPCHPRPEETDSDATSHQCQYYLCIIQREKGVIINKFASMSAVFPASNQTISNNHSNESI